MIGGRVMAFFQTFCPMSQNPSFARNESEFPPAMMRGDRACYDKILDHENPS